MDSKYADIINLPHHVSKNRPHLTMEQRAAQFAPFAALVGYKELTDEAARYVDARPVLSDDAKDELDYKISLLIQNIAHHPKIKLKYFEDDLVKDGGTIKEEEIEVRFIDTSFKYIEDSKGTRYSFEDILSIEE